MRFAQLLINPPKAVNNYELRIINYELIYALRNKFF